MMMIPALATVLFLAQDVTLPLRTRVELFKGSGDWRESTQNFKLDPKKTALIICDMWDRHWCRGATERVPPIAKKAAPVIAAARAKGILIIHAPSDTMQFYANTPQRQAIATLAKIDPPSPRNIDAPALPIDDSDGGCDTGESMFKAWSRQIATIPVEAGDLVSDQGSEVYTALKLRGIENLLVMGVHTNMCVLNRTFAIKQMTRWGVRCILLRDLTDTMYDPKDRPFVPHDQGTELVVEYIEKYWAPSVLSSQLTAVLR
ncbi:MAG: isochorismatase [Acidobacteria bacterium]|nr:isochorismatase [Acidobacteriota bacterium]